MRATGTLLQPIRALAWIVPSKAMGTELLNAMGALHPEPLEPNPCAIMSGKSDGINRMYQVD